MHKHVKKSVKRALSLVLVLMVILLNVSPAFAAADLSGSKELSLSKAISFSGKDAAPALTQSLQKYGVTVDGNTLLAVCPSGTGTGATELRVTQVEGNLVTDSVFVAFDEDGEQISVPVTTSDALETSTGNAYEIDFYDDGSLVFNYAVQYIIYNEYWGGPNYILPRAAMINFSNDGNHEVDYLLLAYHCTGVEYTYPGFEEIYSGPEGYTYTITIEELNPEENYRYFKLDPHENIINISNGTVGPGQAVSYIFGVNGRDYSSGHHVFLPRNQYSL